MLFDINTIKRQLQSYIRMGFSPIPLSGKVAKVRWKEFTLTNTNIECYLRPGMNWGLRTTKLGDSDLWFYVVDIDNKALFGDIYSEVDIPITAPIVSTARGFHIYLAWYEEVKTKHFAGVDIIGNGYVVAPPSVHPNGKPYVFMRGLNSIPPIFDSCQFDRFETREQHQPSLVYKSSVKSGNPIPSADVPYQPTDTLYPQFLFTGYPQGQRHTMLVRIIGALINWCRPEEEALERLLAWNKLNRPPLPEEEIIQTVRYCYKKWDVAS